MRLLLIDEDPTRCSTIQHRLAARQPKAEVVLHSPRLHGTLAPEFEGLGYDAVLLPRQCAGGSGLDWVKDLTARPVFAPVVFLSELAQDPDARQALELGAHAALGRDDLESDRLLDVLETAEEKQSSARTAFRKSKDAQR